MKEVGFPSKKEKREMQKNEVVIKYFAKILAYIVVS